MSPEQSDPGRRPVSSAAAGRLVRWRAEAVLASPARFVLALIANAPTLLKVGWHEPLLPAGLLHGAQVLLLAAYAAMLAFAAFRLRGAPERRRQLMAITRPEQIVVVLGLLSALWLPGPKIAAGLLVSFHLTRAYLRLVQTAIPAGLVFLGSFVMLTLVGTAALLLPAATPPGRPIGFVDALFTITSAISQTGLIVRPTGEGFTRLGQVIILVWIQVGALGVIVFGALLVNVLGGGFGLRATQTIAEGTEQGWSGQLSLQRLVTFIILFTHLLELAGAAVLYVSWPPTWPGAPPGIEEPGTRLYHAVFFSVSAFCNAGFVTTDASLLGLRAHWTSHLVIAPMIVLGSIGFPVLDNLRRTLWARLRGRRLDTASGGLIRLTLNTKLVLAATFALYAVGFVLVLASEVLQTGEPWGLAALDAHFMNINRTAGFSTVDPGQMGTLTQLGLIGLMFIGGSPGSVAGGIKVMVFAVLALTVWATLRGKPEVTAFGRAIPEDVVRKSATLIVLALGVLLAVTGVLTVTEPEADLKELLFEATSALGTCGLSMGVTEDLSPAGRVVVSVTMFLGRVGPFAVLAALLSAARDRRARVRFPREEVVIY